VTDEKRFYDWPATFSRQTGTQGEFCIVIGAKGIGKTFGLRRQCVSDYIKHGWRFCEICRTREELKAVRKGYFDKLEFEGMFTGYIFKVQGEIGYIAREPEKDPETGDYVEKPQWAELCYFVAMTTFQIAKKRTYVNVHRFIFDEAVIDRKDRYHRYLLNEILIFGQLLDTVSRQQPGGYQYRVYLLGNACDLTCPYLRYLGVNKMPEFGYTFYNHKHTLLHYVEPWDQERRETQTLVGRMLAGTGESEMIFGNRFAEDGSDTISPKTPRARYSYAIKYGEHLFGIWIDYGKALCYISAKVPKGAKNVFTLLKADSTLDYTAIERTSPYLQIINRFFYSGSLRYESPAIREMFLTILEFIGIR